MSANGSRTVPDISYSEGPKYLRSTPNAFEYFDPSGRPETCYNCWHLPPKPCGIAFHRHAAPSVPDVSCQKGRKNMRRFHTLQSPDSFRVLTFRKGDTVFLAEGSRQGTVGTFLNFRNDDPKWADIFERNSQVRSHPVAWLEHMPS
jgi:hypothetical protein